MIHHNLEEFTMNFIYIFPNGAQGKLTGSMIVSPGHAKRIWRALGENIARYESQFGSIKESPPANPLPRSASCSNRRFATCGKRTTASSFRRPQFPSKHRRQRAVVRLRLAC